MSSSALAMRPAQHVNRFEQQEIVDTIKMTVCKGATDAQLRMFLEVCKRTGLDPFLKEIWYVAEKGIIMAGRDGYLRVANEHPQFDGIETRVERDAKGVPIKAVCTVWRKDRNHPTICEAFYNEYKKTSPVWTQYPSAMIGKVAEVLALKRSFAINGVVTEEEVGSDPAPLQGSAAERDAVRDAKLAEISDPQPASQDEPPSIGESPRMLTITEFRAAAKAQKIAAFGVLKDAIGSDAYYRILGSAGYEHANQFPTVGAAAQAYAEMLATLQDQQQSRGVV